MSAYSQEKKNYKSVCIAFYNLENLFDTIDDPNKNDEEFLPNGKNRWDANKYLYKLDQMSSVITQIGGPHVPGDPVMNGGPAVIGVSEIENIGVLEDLCATDVMKKSKYRPVLIEGPDRRGVDVGLLYREDMFELKSTNSFRLYTDNENFFTRDQLLVSGTIDGEMMHFIVVHWPSRRGGEKRSASLRAAAADLARHIVDSICTVDPQAKIFIMGDYNDNPTNKSVTAHLKAAPTEAEALETGLLDPMYQMFKKDGYGSNAYRDSWSLFDQIVVSKGLLGKDFSSFKLYKTRIFNKKFLCQKEGSFSGYPLRTFVGTTFQGGYSDHFPVYMFLIKEK